MTKPTFILLTESPSESWKRDTSTFCLAFACMVPGWFLDMGSMTLLGILIFMYITGHSVLKINGDALTPDQARAKIAEIELSSLEPTKKPPE